MPFDICMMDKDGEVVAIVEVDGPHHLYACSYGFDGRDIHVAHATTRRNDVLRDVWALGNAKVGMICLLSSSCDLVAARQWILGLLRDPGTLCDLHQLDSNAEAYKARDEREANAAAVATAAIADHAATAAAADAATAPLPDMDGLDFVFAPSCNDDDDDDDGDDDDDDDDADDADADVDVDEI